LRAFKQILFVPSIAPLPIRIYNTRRFFFLVPLFISDPGFFFLSSQQLRIRSKPFFFPPLMLALLLKRQRVPRPYRIHLSVSTSGAPFLATRPLKANSTPLTHYRFHTHHLTE
jgi:hypothetical protein